MVDKEYERGFVANLLEGYARCVKIRGIALNQKQNPAEWVMVLRDVLEDSHSIYIGPHPFYTGLVANVDGGLNTERGEVKSFSLDGDFRFSSSLSDGNKYVLFGRYPQDSSLAVKMYTKGLIFRIEDIWVPDKKVNPVSSRHVENLRGAD